MGFLDLHMHSLHSADGQYTPTQLMELCAGAGVQVAALADHNCVRGVAEAMEAARTYGIRVIPAVELDCEFEDTHIHLLGYGVRHTDPRYEVLTQEVMAEDWARGRALMENVRALGFRFGDAAVLALANQDIVVGEMLAEVILADPENEGDPRLAPYRPGGLRADNPYVNFYWDFCSPGKAAAPPPAARSMDFSAAMALITATGGIGVLAHPGITVGRNRDAIARMAAQGMAGVEVCSSYHSPGDISFFEEATRAAGLFATLGSDFHGKNKPSVRLGAVDCGGREEALLAALDARLPS